LLTFSRIPTPLSAQATVSTGSIVGTASDCGSRKSHHRIIAESSRNQQHPRRSFLVGWPHESACNIVTSGVNPRPSEVRRSDGVFGRAEQHVVQEG
jgi:hypothetical protein